MRIAFKAVLPMAEDYQGHRITAEHRNGLPGFFVAGPTDHRWSERRFLSANEARGEIDFALELQQYVQTQRLRA